MRLFLIISILYLASCGPVRENKVATEPAPEIEPTPTTIPLPPAASAPVTGRTFTGVRPYGAKAPWNIPVKNLPLHPESKKFADFLWEDFAGKLPELNFRKYTYPVYDATKATDMYVIKDKNNWGNLSGKTIPYNPAWLPNAGTDAQAII